MDVAIHDHRAADPFLALHDADGDGDVVDHAEAFAMVGKGMVESAAEAEADAVLQRAASGQDGAAGVEPESVHQFVGEGDLHRQLFARGQGTGAELVDVVVAVGEKHFVVFRRLWSNEVSSGGDPLIQHAAGDEAVFFGREHMLPDRQIVSVAVDELERKHEEVSVSSFSFEDQVQFQAKQDSAAT